MIFLNADSYSIMAVKQDDLSDFDVPKDKLKAAVSSSASSSSAASSSKH